MRNNLFFIIVLVTMVHTFPVVLAQVNLNQKITIEARNLTIPEFLEMIESEYSIYFAYNPEYFNKNNKVSFSKNATSIKRVLDEALESNYDYKTIGNHIVLTPKITLQNSQKINIKGFITDSQNSPLDSIVIYALKDEKVSISNANGEYSIKIYDRNQYLSISHTEINDTLILAKSLINSGNLKLQARDTSLTSIKMPIDGLKPISASIDTEFKDIGLVKQLVPSEAIHVASQVKVRQYIPIQFSILPFIGTNSLLGGLYVNNLSINILAGYSSGINGIEIGGLVNMIQNNVTGAQLAGISNIVNGTVLGVQCGGISNYNFGQFTGVQAAGIVNISRDKFYGLQCAGIHNHSKGAEGVQISGISNIADGNVEGAQIAGIANYSQEINGIQISGIYNMASAVEGIQIAGIANLSATNINGIQISGVANKAKTLNGLQIGLVNYADTIESGFQLGLFNVVRNGYRAFEFVSTESFELDCSYKTGGRNIYSIINVGANENYTGIGYGLGFIQPIFKRLSSNVDAITSAILSDTYKDVYVGQKINLKLGLNYQIFKHFAITSGVSANLFSPFIDEGAAPSKFEFDKYNRSTFDQSIKNNSSAAWMGWFVGIRL